MAVDLTETRGPEIFAVNLVFGILAVLIVILRTYTRAVVVKSFGLDDWLMILATVFYAIYTFCSSYGTHFGTGQHMANLAPENVKNAMMYWWFCYIFYVLTMICCKLSFAWFLLRITTARIHSWIIYGAALVTVVAGVIFFFVSLFQCRPISLYWDKSQSGKCFDMGVVMAVVYLYSAVSLITDITFAALPGFVIWNLNMAKKTKIALIILIAMGCVACSAIIVRMAYISTLRNPDFLWATVDVVIWSTIEMGLAVSAASLATLRPLARKIAWTLSLASRAKSSTQTLHNSGMPPGTTPSRTQHTQPSGSNVYIMSEFSRDLTYPTLNAMEKFGTRSTAYAELGKGRDFIVQEPRT